MIVDICISGDGRGGENVLRRRRGGEICGVYGDDVVFSFVFPCSSPIRRTSRQVMQPIRIFSVLFMLKSCKDAPSTAVSRCDE